jgi:hypothetical protein
MPMKTTNSCSLHPWVIPSFFDQEGITKTDFLKDAAEGPSPPKTLPYPST